MLLHCIIILKHDSTKWFFQRSKQVEITWCQIWTVCRMCEHLPIRLSNFLWGLMSPLRGTLSWWTTPPCWSQLGGFPADRWGQLIRKQQSVVVCIQSNPRRYKSTRVSLAVPEDAGHDLPYWWLNFEFFRRRRCHVLSAVAKTRIPLKYTWTRQTVILKRCSKSVMNFSTGNTFRHQKFNYYSPFLLHAYIVCWHFE